jgi:Baculovirus FP protein
MSNNRNALPKEVKEPKKNPSRAAKTANESPVITPSEGKSEELFNFTIAAEPIQSLLLNVEEAFSGNAPPGLAGIAEAIRMVLKTLQGMSKTLADQAQTHADLLKENQSQSKQIIKLIEDINICKQENIKIRTDNDLLSTRINELDQYSRNYNLEFEGIPVTAGENTYQIVEHIASYLDVNINIDSIEFCHRQKQSTRNPNKPPAIIAKFYSRQDKERLVLARKGKVPFTAHDIGFQNSTNKVFVNEHLTKLNKHLFWLARNTKQLGFKYSWTRRGIIFIKKEDNSPVIRITKPTDIPVA